MRTTKLLINSIIFFLLVVLGSCETEKPDNYTSISGIWKCEEIDETATVKIFNIDIDKVQNYTGTFIISNFHNIGEEFYIRASVENDTLRIPTQAIQNFIVSGKGVISSDLKTISTEYSIDDGGRTANFIATCFR